MVKEDSQPDVSLGTDSAIKRRLNTTRDRNTQRFQLKSETKGKREEVRGVKINSGNEKRERRTRAALQDKKNNGEIEK